MCGFCNLRVCVCVGFVMWRCVYVWVYVCVGFFMCECVAFVMFGFLYVWIL